MKIKTAIEMLQNYLGEVHPDGPPDEEHAVLLGIEALQRFLSLRNSGRFVGPPMLRSETKE